MIPLAVHQVSISRRPHHHEIYIFEKVPWNSKAAQGSLNYQNCLDFNLPSTWNYSHDYRAVFPVYSENNSVSLPILRITQFPPSTLRTTQDPRLLCGLTGLSLQLIVQPTSLPPPPMFNLLTPGQEPRHLRSPCLSSSELS